MAAAPPLTQADRVGCWLLVVNDNSPLSRQIGEYYARRRGCGAEECLPYQDEA